MKAVLSISLLLSVVLGAPEARAQKKTSKVHTWEAFEGGLTKSTKIGTFHTTLDEGELDKIVVRITELAPAYEKHFSTKLKKGWTFVVLADRKDFTKYAKEVTKGQVAVQGQCFRDKKVVTVCHHKRYGWSSTLSHEYAHAYYDSRGPIWLREGIASLVEVAEVKALRKGRTKKLDMTIPVNPPRLRGLRIHQSRKHYLSVANLLLGKKEADGYGYSYEHGWSLHYFLYSRDAAKYRSFLKAVRKKTARDLSADVEKAFGMKLEKLDQEWMAFTKKLKA